jgi:hypothetical protein
VVHVAEVVRQRRDVRTGELPVVGARRQHLEPGYPLGGTALVGVDVRGVGTDHAAPRRLHGLQCNDIRAGAVEHWERLGAPAELGLDDLLQARGVLVTAVAHLIAGVGCDQRVEHLRMCTGPVVGG